MLCQDMLGEVMISHVISG